MDSSKFKKADSGYSKKKNKSTKRNHKKKKNNKVKNSKQEFLLNNNMKKANNRVRNTNDDYYTYRNDRKKEKENNGGKLTIILILIAFIVVGIIGFLSYDMLTNMSFSSIPNDAVLVAPNDFDYKPDAYYFDNSLYGNFVGTNENGTSTYFLTQKELLALAYNSNNTFNYSEGIYVTYHKNKGMYNEINIVDSLYLRNGTEIGLPEDFDVSSFNENSKQIASRSNYCTKTFGYTGDDYYKIN